VRVIGLDIHRAFGEAVAWDDEKLKRLGRVDTSTCAAFFCDEALLDSCRPQAFDSFIRA
jgi:hypothetical protein